MRAERSRLLPVALLLLLAACTGPASGGNGSGDDATGAPAPAVTTYVALGDSYTSAPFVPSTDLADGCLRSDGNYPSLLAERLEPATFVDVSCSAAVTADLASPQATAGGRGRVAPQLAAVSPDADLVTVGIGANDEGLFARLVTGCAGPAAALACTPDIVDEARAVLERTGRRLTAALRRVVRRAPEATVVLVGYPRLVAPDDPCPLIPVPDDRLEDLAVVEADLGRTMRQAASAAGARYLDMRAASVGHEICSPSPWVNGRRTDEQAALAYHPFASGQRAVADRVLALLREEDAA